MCFIGCIEADSEGLTIETIALQSEALCGQYCDAVMPCDGSVGEQYRDYEDCMHTCEGVSYDIAQISNTCDQAHRELMDCLGTLSCDEALTYSHTPAGSEAKCSIEEEAVLLCQ